MASRRQPIGQATPALEAIMRHFGAWSFIELPDGGIAIFETKSGELLLEITAAEHRAVVARDGRPVWPHATRIASGCGHR